jgi:hypothetical protein
MRSTEHTSSWWSGSSLVGAGFGTTASIDIATGPVKPCQPVSVTAP